MLRSLFPIGDKKIHPHQQELQKELQEIEDSIQELESNIHHKVDKNTK